MTDAEEFILSTYEPIKDLSVTNISKVSLVKNSIDNKLYIIRTLPRDCCDIYLKLRELNLVSVPTIYDVIYNGNTIVIEEYIYGSSLSKIESNGLPYEHLTSYVNDLLASIKLLHENNILHRDIKEDNILISSDNSLYLIDFAISKFITSDSNLCNDIDTLGSFTYSAPEKFSSTVIDERSDIYSLGIVIKNLVNKCNNIPESLQSMWMHIINKCTEFSPEMRFQSVDEILSILTQPVFFYGKDTEHIVKFSNSTFPPCIKLQESETKTAFQILSLDSITISEESGNLHIIFTDKSSTKDYIIFKNKNTDPDEKYFTEIYFLPNSLLIAREYYYPCPTVNSNNKIINHYQLRYLKLNTSYIFELSDIYESLTGFTVLGECESIMDNDTLITVSFHHKFQ